MEEPSLTTSRRRLAGAIAAALALLGGGFLLGRATLPEAERPSALDEPAGTLAPIPVPTLASPLARPKLMALAALAADNTAAGMAPDEELVRNDGRRFEIRLPFGCSGAAAPGAGTGWTYDEASETLRVFVTPQRWTGPDWSLAADRADAVESIEGFWIARPWTSSEACPAQPPEPETADTAAEANPGSEAESRRGSNSATGEPSPPAPQSLAIGQIYTPESARSGPREGEEFRAVKRVAQADLDTSQGFRLRISGRLAASGGRAPALCRQPVPSRRPVCLLTVAMDEIAIENPATGESLAIWTLGQRGSTGAN